MTAIYIGGKARHGKDTAGSFLQAELEKHGKRTIIVHYGDLVKFVAKMWKGWDGAKDDYGRRLLQMVGTDVVRAKNPNYWLRFVQDMIGFFGGDYDYVIIPDCRFPNEIGWAENGVFIRVTRPGFDNGLAPAAQAHASETALDDTPADYLLVNSGALHDLQVLCTELAVKLLREAECEGVVK